MKSRARQQPAAKASPGRTAVMYVRVSSKEQEQGFSIPAQRQLLKDYAEREGIHVVQEFEDVETAKRAGRTSFSEMVDFLRKKSSGCRTLLVEKTDRLYRNIKDWVTIDELGIEVHFVKEAVVLSEDSRSSEKFMHGIKVLMAKNYIDNLGEEVRKGMIEKARQGHWPTVAPVGYVNNLASHRIEPDPERAPIIVKLFEWYASGEYSLKVLTKMAVAAGLTNRTEAARCAVSDPPGFAESDLLRRLLLAGTASQGRPQAGNFSRPLRPRAGRVLSRQPSPPHEAAACVSRARDLRAMRLRIHGGDQEGPIRLLPLHRAPRSVRQHVRS